MTFETKVRLRKLSHSKFIIQNSKLLFVGYNRTTQKSTENRNQDQRSE